MYLLIASPNICLRATVAPCSGKTSLVNALLASAFLPKSGTGGAAAGGGASAAAAASAGPAFGGTEQSPAPTLGVEMYTQEQTVSG